MIDRSVYSSIKALINRQDVDPQPFFHKFSSWNKGIHSESDFLYIKNQKLVY